MNSARTSSATSIVGPLVLSALLCTVWTVYAGKDLNWDQVNYHIYVAHAWVNGRLGQDFFAASVQSYLNPIAYLPFYFAVTAGWHSVVVSILFAVLHSANIALIYFIARDVFAYREPRDQRIMALLAAALGVATPVFWTQVGGSFIDALLTIPMLAGALLALKSGNNLTSVRAGAMGILFGIAAALKYTNAIFAIAAIAFVVSCGAINWRERLYRTVAYAAGGVIAVGILAGPWLWLIYRETGNPVFPLMNGWFKSPYFPSVNFHLERFAPKDFGDMLSLPFRMVMPDIWIYTEISAPDLRFAALGIAAVALAISLVLGRMAGAERPTGLSASHARLLVFFGISYLIWAVASSNGRYGMLLLLLVGICLARIVDRMLPLAVARSGLLVLLVLQVLAVAMASPTRWAGDTWSRSWLQISVPERARETPALYFTVQSPTFSNAIPYFHPASSFVNLRGQVSMSPGGPQWKHVEALLAQHGERVRTFGTAVLLEPDGAPSRELIDAYNSVFYRYGFEVDKEDCFHIPWNRDDKDIISVAANMLVGIRPMKEGEFLLSCRLTRVPHDPELLAEEARVSMIFDRIERACPRLFSGAVAVTERLGKVWTRAYANSDARLDLDDGTLLLRLGHSLDAVHFGNPKDWGQERIIDSPLCRR